LRQAKLQRANLLAVNPSGADLSNATLRGANLEGVQVARTTFSGANLRGTPWLIIMDLTIKKDETIQQLRDA
jgi:uncharacterized protein YjbI with pentapeptide repeats